MRAEGQDEVSLDKFVYREDSIDEEREEGEKDGNFHKG